MRGGAGKWRPSGGVGLLCGGGGRGGVLRAGGRWGRRGTRKRSSTLSRRVRPAHGGSAHSSYSLSDDHLSYAKRGTPLFVRLKDNNGDHLQVCRQWNNFNCKEITEGICCNGRLHICSVCISPQHCKATPCPVGFKNRPRWPVYSEVYMPDSMVPWYAVREGPAAVARGTPGAAPRASTPAPAALLYGVGGSSSSTATTGNAAAAAARTVFLAPVPSPRNIDI